jgi:hypothetical protein
VLASLFLLRMNAGHVLVRIGGACVLLCGVILICSAT